MAKVRSTLELAKYLDADLAWRKFELTNVKANLGRTSQPWSFSLARMGIVMLYAHWEGFVKNATRAYLQFVSEQIQRQGLTSEQLSLHVKTLVLWRQFNSSKGTELARFIEIVGTFLVQALPSDVDFANADELVHTDSNLSAERFILILNIIGLKDKSLESAALVINEKIVKRRHDIAHGGFAADVEVKEYDDLWKLLEPAIDGVSRLILDAATSREYLASP